MKLEGNWHYEYITPDLVQVERVTRVIYEGRTKFQDVLVQDTALYGRSLVLDGKTQSTELDEFVYHEALVQPCMIAHPNPVNVFVAGGGEGATIREALAHTSVRKVTMVDIDEEVVDLCKRYLDKHHKGSFDDPRLELVHDDAWKYLEHSPTAYDVVVIDVPDPLEEGPAYLLFTREFYTLLKERLAPGGLVVAQSGPTGPSFYEQCFAAVAHTMSAVFPKVYYYDAFVPSFGTTWGFVVGSLGPDVAALSPQEVDSRIAARVKTELRFYDGVTHQGMFSTPKFLRQAVAAEERIITRENPLYVV
jgi:spermidine synthase